MAIPTLDELREMSVSAIHALLTNLATTNAAQRLELDNLRHWQAERDGLLEERTRLQQQLEAVCGELDRYHERWGDIRE